MSDPQDTSPEDKTCPQSQNISQVLEIPSLKQEHDVSTPEERIDGSIASEAPTKEPEFELLNPGDSDDGEPATLTKSGTSSLGSFTEVDSLPQSPGLEMTMEHSDMKKLLHEAGRESGESSNETEEQTPPSETDNEGEGSEPNEKLENVLDVKIDSEKNVTSLTSENCTNDVLSETNLNVLSEAVGEGFNAAKDDLKPEHEREMPETIQQNEPGSTSAQDVPQSNDGKSAVDSDTLSDLSKISEDHDVTLFSSITYLGSSTVNAPVSDTELKRTMAFLKQQGRVAINIILSVADSFNGQVKLLDPQNKTVIATYQLQKILFCGRGDGGGKEEDCFAFNICHGNNDIFHCHVFRCLEKDAAAKVLTRFANSFRNKLKLQSDSGLVYKFHLVFDILEDDGKGSYSSVPRDKTCFKIRRDVHKQINIQLHQLSNRLLIIERCFGLLICPGRHVTHSDMNLLEKVTMDNTDNGRTYVITGNWDPEREDTLVLNTETKKDFTVYMTVAVDFVVTGISEPVRFLKELGVKVYPSNERFWNPSRPKIKEQYTLELKLATNEEENEKSYEVLNLQCSTQQDIKEILTSHTEKVEDNDIEDDDDDDEPLMSGSGQVNRECSEEQLDNWSVIMTKWKDVNSRPKQVKALIRKEGVPEPWRAKVWQMLVGLEDSDYLVESYKDLIKRESPNEQEQVIHWDIHRTYPGHEYFRSSEGQENLQKICRAYSVYDDEVGYCQGMSFLAAVLLLHLPEEQAFGVFVKIMYDYNHRELFLHGFEKLRERFFVLERITEEFLPDLHSHFLENSVEPHMFSSQWFLTLFTAKFPLPLVYRIMDLYLSEGGHCIYQIATALLKVAKKDLLQLPFEGILKYFRVSLPRRFFSEDERNNFMNVVMSYKAVVKKLKRYEELFELKKERERENEDPVERLLRENKQLMLTNIRFEQENDALAHELINTKVSLRSKLDEAEEHAEDYLRELNILRGKVPELQNQNLELRAEGSRVKEILRKNTAETEAMRQRYESLIEEYKKICSQFDERSEELKSNLENELREIKRRIGSCTNCSRLITGDGNDDGEALPGNTFKPSVKITDAEQRLKEVELELAQTKLSLVEAECNVQDLEHRLSSFMSAVAAEESKPWFRRSKLGTPAKK